MKTVTKITKKEIAENTNVNRGSGFNPRYSYHVNINGRNFTKNMMDDSIYLDDAHSGEWIGGRIAGNIYNKKDFVSAIYNYINN